MSQEFYVQTYSGRAFPLHNPQPESVYWIDVAWSLAQMCRFNGHTSQYYSIAQHSIIVARQLPEQYRLYGLLHDAHEAYTGDIVTPLKYALGADAMRPILDLQHLMDRAIFLKAGLQFPLPARAAALIEIADRVALATEARDVITNWVCASDTAPLRSVIKPMPPDRAADAWLRAFEEMKP